MHVVQPLIVIWFLRRWRRMVIALAAYDVLLVAAIIMLEWHYVIDIIAGVFVAALAIVIVEWPFRRENPQSPAPAYSEDMKNFPFISRSAFWLLLSIVSAASMAHYVTAIWSANQPPRISPTCTRAGGERMNFFSMAAIRIPRPSPTRFKRLFTVLLWLATRRTIPPASPADLPIRLCSPTSLAHGSHYIFSRAKGIPRRLCLARRSSASRCGCVSFRFRSPLRYGSPSHCSLLGSFPALQAIKLQNLSLIAAAFIAVTVFSLSDRPPWYWPAFFWQLPLSSHNSRWRWFRGCSSGRSPTGAVRRSAA